VTTTLPERTLQELEAIDNDRARAIVKAAAMAVRSNSQEAIFVEVIEVFPGRAVILVGPSKSLRKIGWLRMVEIAPARFLLVIPTGTALEALEVAMTDLLGNLAQRETYEHKLLTELHRVLSHRRREQRVSKAEILLLNTTA
jgi:transposase